MTVLNSVDPEANVAPQFPEKLATWYVPSTFLGAPANYMVQYLPPPPAAAAKRSAWFHILTAPAQPRTFGLFAYYMLFAPMMLLASLFVLVPLFWGGVCLSIVLVGIVFVFMALYMWKVMAKLHLWFMKVFVNFSNIDDLETEPLNIGFRNTLSSRVSWIGCVAYQLIFPLCWLISYFFIKVFFLLTCASFAITVVKVAAPAYDPLDNLVGKGIVFGTKGVLVFFPAFVMSLYCCTWTSCVVAHIERALAFKMFTHKAPLQVSYQMMGNTMTAVAQPKTHDRTRTKRACRIAATLFWVFLIVSTMIGAIHVGLNLRCSYIHGEHVSFAKTPFTARLPAYYINDIDEIVINMKKLKPMCYWSWSRKVPSISVQYTDERLPFVSGELSGVQGLDGVHSGFGVKDNTLEFSMGWSKQKYHYCSLPKLTLHVPRKNTLKLLRVRGAALEVNMEAVEIPEIKTCIKRGHLTMSNVTASITAKVKEGLITIKGSHVQGITASMKVGELQISDSELIGDVDLRVNNSGNIYATNIGISSLDIIDGTRYGSHARIRIATKEGSASIDGLTIPDWVKFSGAVLLESNHSRPVFLDKEYPYSRIDYYNEYMATVAALNVKGFHGYVHLTKGLGKFSHQDGEGAPAKETVREEMRLGTEGEIAITREKDPHGFAFSDHKVFIAIPL